MVQSVKILAVCAFLRDTRCQETAVEAASNEVIDEWFDQGTVDDPMFQEMNQELQVLQQRELSRSGISGFETDRLGWLRRMKELKKVVLWLQHDPRFGQFCYYGCWCLPDGNHGFTKGVGKPVDNVDKSCHNQYRCYHCAKKDFGANLKHECDPAKTKYNYRLTWDPTNKRDVWARNIECLDSFGNGDNESCSRAICECDRALAIQLREHVQEWVLEKHSTWGPFNKTEQCTKQKGNNGGNKGEEQCCGDYQDGVRFPYRDNSGMRGCCGRKTYDTQTLQCCADDTLKGYGNMC